MGKVNGDYRADIDGMRALAVGLVLLFHFDLLPVARAGFIGVDVFYVISGFLITGIILRDFDAGRFRLRDFYLRRVRRLAPALLCMQILVLGIGAYLLLPADFVELARQSLATQLYVANIYYWQTYNYFGISAQSAFLLHTWSLAVEEQFYLFYPLLLIIVLRYCRRYIDVALLLLAALSFALNLAQVHVRPEATFYLLPTRAWELLIGALAARLLSQGRVRIDRWQAECLGVMGLGLLATGVVTYSLGTPFPGYFALLPTLGTLALLISGGQPNMTARLLSVPAIRYVGVISYPAYLVHWPVRVFGARVLNESANLPGWRWAMLALSLMLAALIYHAVEIPVRLNIRLRMPRTLLLGYLGSVSVVVLFCVMTMRTGGLPARFPSAVDDLAAFAEDKEPPLTECEWTSRSKRAFAPCRIGATGPETWLVFGDSHAWATYDAFNLWLSRRGEGGQFAYLHACPPLFGVYMVADEGNCYGFNQAIRQYLDVHPSIRNVALVSSWREGAEGRLSRTADQLLAPEASNELFRQAFQATLETLSAMHRDVYIWEPVPGAKQSVPQALAMAVLHRRPANIAFTRAEYEDQFAFFFAAEHENASMITARFSPSRKLCPIDDCELMVSGRPLYFDNDHPSRSTIETWIDILNAGSPP
jgi:peptidoglycan/LPS O-acetylase OafA/YrhL